MHFWIFENFLKIFGNLRKSSQIFGKSPNFLKIVFLKLFCESLQDNPALQTTYHIGGNYLAIYKIKMLFTGREVSMRKTAPEVLHKDQGQRPRSVHSPRAGK